MLSRIYPNLYGKKHNSFFPFDESYPACENSILLATFRNDKFVL